MLLTESWSSQFSDIHVDNFEYFNINRFENKAYNKRYSGGLTIYIRHNLVSTEYSRCSISVSEDDIICVKINSQMLELQHDLFICLCYVILENGCCHSMIESNTLDRLLNHIVS